ncbi:perlucin-like protein [Mytilus trossulus]|uniref:perlucin-like protein n=1 Tax=Mytilus trossulus TaxID=6551 RepID=UPI0030049025
MNIFIIAVIIGVCSATMVQPRQETVDEECRSCATISDLKNELAQLRLMITQIDNTCKTQVKTCSTRPCLNGGTCTHFSSSYQCKCLNGFSGKDCQVCAISANDWTLYDGKYYMFVKNAINWMDAQNDCLSRGGRLAEVNSQNVGAWLKRQASQRGGGWWLGATDLVQEGTWKWTSGNQIGYSDWAYGEPNNTGQDQDCLQLWDKESYLWDDLWCTSERNYICQRKTCNSDE